MQEMRQRLSTLDEGDEGDPEDGDLSGRRSQSMEQQQANQCAAELLRTSSLIALGALDAGTAPRLDLFPCKCTPLSLQIHTCASTKSQQADELRAHGPLAAQHPVSCMFTSAARWKEGRWIDRIHRAGHIQPAVLRGLNKQAASTEPCLTDDRNRHCLAARDHPGYVRRSVQTPWEDDCGDAGRSRHGGSSAFPCSFRVFSF